MLTTTFEVHMKSSYETLQSTGEVKLMSKFYAYLHNFSLWNLLCRVPIRNCFQYYVGKRKCKKDYETLKIILLQGFCPL